jgi:hypothetical protein
MDDQRVPVRFEGILDAVVDGERILLNPTDFVYFGLTGSGGEIWNLIDGTRTVGDIASALEASYEAPDGVIRVETLTYIEALRDAALIQFREPA